MFFPKLTGVRASHLDRMEWMYDWGNKVKKNDAEEYLLGKPIQTTNAESALQKHGPV